MKQDRDWAEDLELQARLEAHEELIPFCHYVSPWFKSPAHVRFLAPYYEAIERGDIDRLMVLMPPRHGKTNLGLHFLAWYLARNPRDEIVLASYNSPIAEYFSGKVRRVVEQPQYAALRDESVNFGARLDPKFGGRDLWQTVEGSVFRAAGMKSGVSGFGGCGIYIDDFLKGREDADSTVIRQKISEVYSAELYPRLMPRYNDQPPWIVMTYTPWHPDDLGQEELTAMLAGTGDNWTLVRLPAIAEADDPMGRAEGEALWPERYSLETLARIRRVLDRKNPRDWPALYQCRPNALEGTFYKLPMLPDLDRGPKVGRVSHIIISDLAAGGDETAHGVVEIDQDKNCAFVEVWHARCDTLAAADAFLDVLQKYRSVGGGVTGWVHAKGQIDASTHPLFVVQAEKRNIPLPLEFPYNEKGDKLAMSSSIQGYCLAGRVRFDHQAPWWPWMRDQCLAFTGAEGNADEGPDLLKMLGLHLDKVVAPPVLTHNMTVVQEDKPW